MQLGRSYSDRGTFSCNSRHGVAPRLTRTSLQKNASHSSVHSFDLRQAWATRGGGGLGSGVREPATSRGAELAGAARHLRVPAARLARHQRTSLSLTATGQEHAWLAAPHAAGCGGPGLSPRAETTCSLRTVPHTPRLTPEGPRYLHDSAETLAR